MEDLRHEDLARVKYDFNSSKSKYIEKKSWESQQQIVADEITVIKRSSRLETTHSEIMCGLSIHPIH